MDIILPDEIGRHYNKIADIFEQKRSFTVGLDYVQKFLCLLLSKLKKSNPYIILDIGCGTGIPLTRHLVDILTSKIERKFDGIIAWDSLFHIPLDRQENIIKKLLDCLIKMEYFFLLQAGNMVN